MLYTSVLLDWTQYP